MAPSTPGRTGRARSSAAPLAAHNLHRRSWKPLVARAGLPGGTRFHDLRHTCATLLLGRGVHPKLVQSLLGHASIEITPNTYSHVMPEMGARPRAMDEGRKYGHLAYRRGARHGGYFLFGLGGPRDARLGEKPRKEQERCPR